MSAVRAAQYHTHDAHMASLDLSVVLVHVELQQHQAGLCISRLDSAHHDELCLITALDSSEEAGSCTCQLHQREELPDRLGDLESGLTGWKVDKVSCIDLHRLASCISHEDVSAGSPVSLSHTLSLLQSWAQMVRAPMRLSQSSV